MRRLYVSEDKEGGLDDSRIWVELDEGRRFELTNDRFNWEGRTGKDVARGTWEQAGRKLTLLVEDSDWDRFPAGTVISIDELDDDCLILDGERLSAVA